MKPYNGFTAEPTRTAEALPAGGYVAKIVKAEEAHYDWGNMLLIYFDIAEGEHKGHFKTQYDGQQGEDKKWKGVYRQSVPKDDGSDKDEWSKRSFNNAIWAIEESNTGYHWDWNEASLKGKTVGVLFRNREWEYNGKTGWTTECCALTDVTSIREGKFRIPKDKPLANKTENAFARADVLSDIDDDDCPF